MMTSSRRAMASSHNSKSLQSCGSEDRPGGERENQRLAARSPGFQAQGVIGSLVRPGPGSQLTLLVSLLLHFQNLFLHKAEQLCGVGHPQHEWPQLNRHSLRGQGHLRDPLRMAEREKGNYDPCLTPIIVSKPKIWL